ncbi:unnamed protein product [Rangifer tarandus platyrhynchus]|uniref:Uncharacterized protein n=1 Tax=Rangifer tarandus platyrhynchus TaxID=3082113 RepID=A0AC59YII5_RANTA
MAGQWLPSAGILLAAALVVLAPALPLPPAHEDLGPFPWTSGTSALQAGSKEILLPSLNRLVPVPAGVSPSAEKSGEAPGRRARGLFPEAPGDQQGLLGVLLDLQLLPNQPAPLGPSGAPGGATHRPAPPAVAEPAAHSTPKSQPVSHVAAPGDGEEIFVPGSPERAATSPLQASPQLQSQPVSRHLLNPKVWTLSASGASNFRPGNAPLLMLAPRVPEKAVSSASQGPLAFTSISHVPHSGLRLPQKWSGVQSGPGSFSVAIALNSTLFTVVISITATIIPTHIPITHIGITVTHRGSRFPLHCQSRNLPGCFCICAPPHKHRPPLQCFQIPPAQSLPVVPGMAALQRTVRPRPLVPDSPASVATLSLRCALGLPAGCPRVPGGVASPQSSSLSRPRQTVSLQDSRCPSPRASRVTHFVTFRITSRASVVALGSPASPEHQLLKDSIRHQLQSLYHEAFSSFEGVGILQFRPDSAAVSASLLFGGHVPGPSAREVLWTLHRSVKAAGRCWGTCPWMRAASPRMALLNSQPWLSGSNLTDLALETLSIHLTAMEPFHPLLLLPGSAPFVLLEKKILPQVTAVVAEFYSAHPQEGPLLLFSNADQWVGLYIEYKFQTPIATHLPGLANHLARNIMDPTVQKSSIMANGEKAELVLCEVWLQILDQPFTEALKDKTSPRSQRLRGQLTRWLTTVLRPLRTFGQVVVEKFQPDPLTARVTATFFRPAPARALVQGCMFQGLRALQETEGLSAQMVIPDLSQADTFIPCYAGDISLSWVSCFLRSPWSWCGSRRPVLGCPDTCGAPSCCRSSSETKFQTSPPAPTCSQPSRVSAQP